MPAPHANAVRQIFVIVNVLVDVEMTDYAADCGVRFNYTVHGLSDDVKSAYASCGRTTFTDAKFTPSL